MIIRRMTVRRTIRVSFAEACSNAAVFDFLEDALDFMHTLEDSMVSSYLKPIKGGRWCVLITGDAYIEFENREFILVYPAF